MLSPSRKTRSAFRLQRVRVGQPEAEAVAEAGVVDHLPSPRAAGSRTAGRRARSCRRGRRPSLSVTRRQRCVRHDLDALGDQHAGQHVVADRLGERAAQRRHQRQLGARTRRPRCVRYSSTRQTNSSGATGHLIGISAMSTTQVAAFEPLQRAGQRQGAVGRVEAVRARAPALGQAVDRVDDRAAAEGQHQPVVAVAALVGGHRARLRVDRGDGLAQVLDARADEVRVLALDVGERCGSPACETAGTASRAGRCASANGRSAAP